jgi:hypothetical protein
MALTPSAPRTQPAVGVNALLNGTVDVGASSSAPPVSVSSSATGDLATSRVIASRGVGFTWIAPPKGDDSKKPASKLILGSEFLENALGGEYQGIKLTPKRAILSGLRLSVTNNCDYEVNVHVPDYVDAEMCSAGSGHVGALHLFPGESVDADLLADEAVVQDNSITSLQTFTPKQLELCEDENKRGAWKVFAKMEFGGNVIDNPVLKEMKAAGIIDEAHWKVIQESASDAEVQNINKDTYVTYRNRLISHASHLNSRLHDLTQMTFTFARADGKNFDEMPEHIARQTGEHGEQARAKFRNVPGTINARLNVEYASDAVTKEAQ